MKQQTQQEQLMALIKSNLAEIERNARGMYAGYVAQTTLRVIADAEREEAK